MFWRAFAVAVCAGLLCVSIAQADINAYIHDLNVSVQGDIGGYKAKLATRFGVSGAQVEVVFRDVGSPAEAAVVFWLGEQSRQPIDRVLEVYRSQKGRGWGGVAKSLGIKPGSAAFHALKRGDIPFSLHNVTSKGQGKDKKAGKNKQG
jgi:hypothetical protein